jgi:thiamine kinase-like enzyme
MKHKDREFLEKIPAIVNSLKEVHKIKTRKKDRIIVKNKKQEEKEWQKGLKLVRQYYPSAIDEVTLWVKKCRTLRNRNKKYFNVDSYKMTHGDFYSRNILINNGLIKLIDFSNSCFCDPLNDVGNFLINTELMFEYDFHDNHRQLMEILKDIFLKNYFSKPATKEQKFKINYFILTNLIRIIAFAAMSEGSKKIPSRSNVVMDKLIKIGEEKYNNL